MLCAISASLSEGYPGGLPAKREDLQRRERRVGEPDSQIPRHGEAIGMLKIVGFAVVIIQGIGRQALHVGRTQKGFYRVRDGIVKLVRRRQAKMVRCSARSRQKIGALA